MLKILFRIKRKLSRIFGQWSKYFILFEMRCLFPKRFIVSSDIIFGKLFDTYFDISSSSIEIGQQVQFRDFCKIYSGINGKLRIGHRAFFNNNCTINCLLEINIGNDCQFGEGVKLYDHNHAHTVEGKSINQQGYTFGSITIGNNCWVGSNVIILKDVTIGDNVIIGAGCLVHKSIPSNTIVINKQELVTRNK